MKNLLTLLPGLLLKGISGLPQDQGSSWGGCLVSLAAFISLILGYGFGCQALYRYMEPYWGEAISLGALGMALVLTSGLLFVIAWFLKPKPSPSRDLIKDLVGMVEKGISELPDLSVLKKLLPPRLPKPLILASTFAVFVYCLVSAKRREDTDA